MGYRSEVVIMVDEKHTKAFQKEIEPFRQFAVNICPNGIHIDEIEWDDLYPEIKKFQDFLFSLDDDQFAFMRLGQDLEDMETHGCPSQFGIFVDRRITHPFEKENPSKSLLYKFDGLYDGKNPHGLRFEVHKAGEDGIYNEVAVDCFDLDGNLVGDAYIGLCQDKKDMRVLLTADGKGGNDQKIAVYPMRPRYEAVDMEWGN